MDKQTKKIARKAAQNHCDLEIYTNLIYSIWKNYMDQ